MSRPSAVSFFARVLTATVADGVRRAMFWEKVIWGLWSVPLFASASQAGSPPTGISRWTVGRGGGLLDEADNKSARRYVRNPGRQWRRQGLAGWRQGGGSSSHVGPLPVRGIRVSPGNRASSVNGRKM